MVCIIDDREDVWQGCGNLVQVKPYHFFPHTGDIHAPPGLEKNDPATPISTPVKETQNKNNNNGTLHSTDKDVLNNDTKDESIIKEHESVATSEGSKCTNDDTGDTGEKEKNIEIQSTDAEKQSENDTEQIKEVDNKTLNSKETEKEEKRNENKFIDEDEDDYLLYLEDILRKIHAEFYNNIEKEIGQKSLRVIIPRVRAQVLKGICLTFSGLIPTHQKLNQSRAYKVARAFGAEVTQVRLFINILFLLHIFCAHAS